MFYFQEAEPLSAVRFNAFHIRRSWLPIANKAANNIEIEDITTRS